MKSSAECERSVRKIVILRITIFLHMALLRQGERLSCQTGNVPASGTRLTFWFWEVLELHSIHAECPLAAPPLSGPVWKAVSLWAHGVQGKVFNGSFGIMLPDSGITWELWVAHCSHAGWAKPAPSWGSLASQAEVSPSQWDPAVGMRHLCISLYSLLWMEQPGLS